MRWSKEMPKLRVSFLRFNNMANTMKLKSDVLYVVFFSTGKIKFYAVSAAYIEGRWDPV